MVQSLADPRWYFSIVYIYTRANFYFHIFAAKVQLCSFFFGYEDFTQALSCKVNI